MRIEVGDFGYSISQELVKRIFSLKMLRDRGKKRDALFFSTFGYYPAFIYL